MNSKEVVRKAARAVVVYGRKLSDEEKAAVERATAKVGEEIHLVDVGRLDLHGFTPADLVKSALGSLATKPCGCPDCRNRKIFD